MADAQVWLDRHFPVANPVEEMVRRSGIPERTFKRRFTLATGLAALDYVQRLRIEYAKRRLEQSDTPIDQDQLGGRIRGPRLLPQAFPARHRRFPCHLPAQVPRAELGETRGDRCAAKALTHLQPVSEPPVACAGQKRTRGCVMQPLEVTRAPGRV